MCSRNHRFERASQLGGSSGKWSWMVDKDVKMKQKVPQSPCLKHSQSPENFITSSPSPRCRHLLTLLACLVNRTECHVLQMAHYYRYDPCEANKEWKSSWNHFSSTPSIKVSHHTKSTIPQNNTFSFATRHPPHDLS